MELRIVATGSHGNTYVLTDKTGRLLMLDCGVPMPEIWRAVGYKTAALDFCLVTHAHLDHSASAKKMLDAFMPVTMSSLTAQQLNIPLSSPMLKVRNENETLNVGNWTIQPFSTFHDAVGSLGYLIYNKADDITLAYVADSGHIKYTFPKLNVLISECNYDNSIEQRKDEIADRYLRLRESHMSLDRLVSYLDKAKMPNLRNVVIVHLSDSNSNEAHMLDELRKKTGVTVDAAREGLTINLDKVPF